MKHKSDNLLFGHEKSVIFIQILPKISPLKLQGQFIYIFFLFGSFILIYCFIV